MSTKLTRRIERTYTPEQVDRALLELAITGSSVAARRRLAAQGLEVSDPHVARVEAGPLPGPLHGDREPPRRKVEDVIVQQARELALKAAEVERKALDKQLKALDGTVKDASASARNAAVVKGVNVDKLLTLSGRPSKVVEHRQADDLIRKLKTIARTFSSTVKRRRSRATGARRSCRARTQPRTHRRTDVAPNRL
jgi:hypothetical protein